MSPNFNVPDGLDLDMFDFAAPTFPSVSTKPTAVPGTSSKRSTRRTTMLMPDLRQSLNEVTPSLPSVVKQNKTSLMTLFLSYVYSCLRLFYF